MNPSTLAPKIQTLALLGSYVPRQCGIATFTNDLRNAIAEEIGEREAVVVAMDDQPGGYAYPPEVRFQIPQHDPQQYITAADMLNINEIDCVLVQHEYGIYGGKDGGSVLELVRALRMPVITTLHTILSEPSTSQRQVLRELARLSDRVVVMSNRAQEMLESIYNISRQKIAFIPHGIHDVPFVDPSFFRDQFGVEGKKVLLTFGLLSPGKGIELAIRALPKVVARHPDVVYLILGATHPHVLKSEGNAYRNSLETLVAQLGLKENVAFHNRYVSTKELLRYISVADIYITPYPNRQQITSGTLAYALGAGKPVISTPYWYAEEMLAEGRGRLFAFDDVEGLSDAIIELLENDTERHAIRKRAYLHGRPMIWREVARSYLSLAEQVIRDRAHRPRPLLINPPRAAATGAAGLPDLSLAHLRRLSDDTGIFQHAIYATPNRHHGYCVDDNARALLAALLYFELTRDESILPLADVYLSFMHHAFNESKVRFRNFMSYDRRWLEEVGSEDVHGRSIWALGTAVWLAPNDSVLQIAMRLLNAAMPPIERFTSPRAWAFSVIGLTHYLRRFSGDTAVRRVRQTLANRLLELFERNSDRDWPWCEDVVTYDNAKLPHALLLAGHECDNPAMRQRGLEGIWWLIDRQMNENGRVSLIGNHGWLRRDGQRARFDQQPIEGMAMVEAIADAYRITGDERLFDHARRFTEWFTGNNDLGASLYDYQTGGCRDGLHPDGTNLNQGAESTLAWLIASLTLRDLYRTRALADAERDTTKVAEQVK